MATNLNQIRFHLKEDIKIEEIVKFLEEFRTGVEGASISSVNFKPEDTKNLTQHNLKVTYNKKPDNDEISSSELISLLQDTAFYIYQYGVDHKKYNLLPKEGDAEYESFWVRGKFENPSQSFQKESASYLLKVALAMQRGEKATEKETLFLSASDLKTSLISNNPLADWAGTNFQNFIKAVQATPLGEKFVVFNGQKYDFTSCLNQVLDPYYKSSQDFLKSNPQITKKISQLRASHEADATRGLKKIDTIITQPLPFFGKNALRQVLENEEKTPIDEVKLKTFFEDFSLVAEVLSQDLGQTFVSTPTEEDHDEGGADERSDEAKRETISLEEVVARIKNKVGETDIKKLIAQSREKAEKEGSKPEKSETDIRKFFENIDEQIGLIFGSEYKDLKDLVVKQIRAENSEALNYNPEKQIFIYENSYTHNYKDSLDEYINGLADLIVEYATVELKKSATEQKKPPEETDKKAAPAVPIGAPGAGISPKIWGFLKGKYSQENLGWVDSNGQINIEKWSRLSISQRRSLLRSMGLLPDIYFYAGIFLEKNGVEATAENIRNFLQSPEGKRFVISLFNQALLEQSGVGLRQKLIGPGGTGFKQKLNETIVHFKQRKKVFEDLLLVGINDKIVADKDKLQQFLDKNRAYRLNLENTLYSLASQAVLDEIDPIDYIKSLSLDELRSFFNLPADFNLETEFKNHLLAYFKINEDQFNFDKLIKNPKKTTDLEDKEKRTFKQRVFRLRNFSKNLDRTEGGKQIYQTLTVPEFTFYEEIIGNEEEIKSYQRRQAIIRSIWRQYSKDEQNAIKAAAQAEAIAVSQMPVYEQERVLAHKAESEAAGFRQRLLKSLGRDKKTQNKKRAANRLGKAIGGIALDAVGGAAANLALPGLGLAVNALGKTVGILLPKKYKKYGILAPVALIAGLLAYTFQTFITSVGGFAGGILGGAGGLLVGGPAGIVPGWIAGTHGGKLFETQIINGLKDIGGLFKGVGSGVSEVGQIVGVAGKTFLAIPQSLPAATMTAVFGGAGLLAYLTLTSQQAAFLTNIRETLDITADSSSKYVLVEKTVNLPQNHLENTENKDVVYRVAITARDNYTITVASVSDNINVFGAEKAPTFSISPPTPEEQLPTGTQILPGSPIILEYTVPSVSGTDIALNNNFVLNFSVEDGGEIKTETAQASVLITIGDPELGCFEFMPAGSDTGKIIDGENIISIAWNTQDQSRILTAAQTVAANPTFLSHVCNGGVVKLYKLRQDPRCVSSNETPDGLACYGGWEMSADSIGLYPLGLSSQNGTTYTLIHELGHILDLRNPGLRNSFNTVWSGSYFTYPFTFFTNKSSFEPFAEAVVLNVVSQWYPFSTQQRRTAASIYRESAEYNWIRDNIYGGAEF